MADQKLEPRIRVAKMRKKKILDWCWLLPWAYWPSHAAVSAWSPSFGPGMSTRRRCKPVKIKVEMQRHKMRRRRTEMSRSKKMRMRNHPAVSLKIIDNRHKGRWRREMAHFHWPLWQSPLMTKRPTMSNSQSSKVAMAQPIQTSFTAANTKRSKIQLAEHV